MTPTESRDAIIDSLRALEKRLFEAGDESSRQGRGESYSRYQKDRWHVREARGLIEALEPEGSVEDCHLQILELLDRHEWNHFPSGPAEDVRGHVRAELPDEHVQRFWAVKSGRAEATVFLSYTSADRPIVHAFAEILLEAGFEVWYDQQTMQVGDEIHGAISRGVDGARFVCVFLSRRSVESPWVQEEVRLAVASGLLDDRGILPVLIEPCEVPDELEPLKWTSLGEISVKEAADAIIQSLDSSIRASRPAER